MDVEPSAEARPSESNSDTERASDMRRANDVALARSFGRPQYGWQIALADLHAIPLVALSLVPKLNASQGVLGLAGVGLLLYPTIAPIVHGANGHPVRAFGSFALRAVSLPAGAVIGLLASDTVAQQRGSKLSDSDGATFYGLYGGMVGAMLATSALDALVLAHDEPKLFPTVSASRAGATFAIGGRL